MINDYFRVWDKEMKILAQQDDCAPDSLEYFIKDIKTNFGLKFHDFKKAKVVDDGMCLSWGYQDYILVLCADDPFYVLGSLKPS